MRHYAEFTKMRICGNELLSIRHTGASMRQQESNNYKNSQVVYGDCGDLGEFGMWAENKNQDPFRTLFWTFSNRSHMFQKIKFMPFQMPPKRASNSCQSFLEHILQKDPFNRLGSINDFQDVSEHEFFQSIDFDKLEKMEITPPWIPEVSSNASISNIDQMFTNSPTVENEAGSSLAVIVSPSNGANFLGFTWAPPIVMD